MKHRQRGFGAVEVIVIVLIIAVLGFGGWFVYKNQQSKKQAQTTTGQPAENAESQQLAISEWGVTLQVEGLSDKVSYKIVSDSRYLKPSAFLSTQALDGSSACTKYYSDPTYPSFQYIERYAPTDEVPLDEGLRKVSLADAAKEMPTDFKVIGGFGYWFRHGSGWPCPEAGGQVVYNAYKAWFSTMQAVQ